MTGLEIIARMQSMKKEWKCVTLFAGGSERVHETVTEGQANNYAVAERRKIGKELVNRETGAKVLIVAVVVERI